jgi:hypothetical protein
MLKSAPPLFTDFPDAVPPPPVGTDGTDDHWWDIATRICNEVLDADSLAEIDAIKSHRDTDLRDLLRARRDLARSLSNVFAEQRQALKAAAP